MDITPFNAPVSAKRRTKAIKIRDGTEVPRGIFVYKLYDAIPRQAMQWHILHGIGAPAVTISRAVERGWSFSRTPLEPLGCAD